MRGLLIAAFVVSGAAGLVYESVWSRYIGLFVGHSAYAQILTLGVFLGGMALGAAIAARYASRIRHPLIWYAGIEVAIAVIGLGFHYIYGATTTFAYDSLFPSLGGTSLLVAKWALAALLILPQSILLGTTFPLMSGGVMRMTRAVSGAGRTLSLLYFANSIGAAGGVLLAGFFLAGYVGLDGSLVVAALANLLAAAVAFAVSGWLSDEERAPLTPDEAPAATSLADRSPAAVRHALLVVACGTAIASFIYEIAWIRMLSLVLGSATHSFELMLSAFILGLALGALWVRSRADTFRDPLRTLAIVQWVMGVLALATIPFYLLSFTWTAWWLEALARNDNGYQIFSVVRYAFCLAVMLPATFCAGMTLPLITRTMMAAGGGEKAIGTVYSVNTLGSIVGAAAAGLVLIPTVGLKATLIIGAVLDMALGVYLLVRFFITSESDRRLLMITAGGGVIVVLNVIITQPFDRGILTSGVYRYAAVPAPGQRTLAFYKDGRTATVSVRGDIEDGYSLATNGKPDASLTKLWLRPLAPGEPRPPIGGDQVTQAFLPIITLAHKPDARTGAVIGFGSGVSSHVLLGAPGLRQVVTLEIEPAMVEASRLFLAANRRVYEDPRSTIVIDDAKSYFASAGQRFDLIVSEPSNPWVSGVSGLFTDEFYARVKRYLTDDGVFGQWLHLYELNDDLVSYVIGAIHRNFPAYEIFFASSVDILIVATPAARLPEPDWGVTRYEGISEDLTRFRQLSPQVFDALRLAGRDVFTPLVAAGLPANSDFNPYLDLGAEKTRFDRSQANAVIGLGTDRFPLGLVLAGRRTGFGADVAPAVQIGRVEDLAIGAALRAGVVPPDTGAEHDVLRRARYRLGTLRAQMAAGAPTDWASWLRDALAVDRDLHGGTAGVADEQFFNEVLGYAIRNRAPERVTVALRFLRAISLWDWEAADALGSRVIEIGSQAQGLPLSGDLVRDAVVVAKLRTGDVASARRLFDLLYTHGARARTDLRTRIVDAWVTRAEEAARDGAAPGSPGRSGAR